MSTVPRYGGVGPEDYPTCSEQTRHTKLPPLHEPCVQVRELQTRQHSLWRTCSAVKCRRSLRSGESLRQNPVLPMPMFCCGTLIDKKKQKRLQYNGTQSTAQSTPRQRQKNDLVTTFGRYVSYYLHLHPRNWTFSP